MTKATLSVVIGMWLALTLAFIALRVLPGDAITAQLTEAGLSASVIEQRRAALGFDSPIFDQYLRYIGGLFRGDFGQSLYTGERVEHIIAARAASTISLAAAGFALMIIFSITLAAAASGNHPLTGIAQAIIVTAVALPGYISGTFLIFVVGLADFNSISGVLSAAVVLGFHSGGAVAQSLAESVRQVRSQAYITAAYGRGLSSWHIFGRHILPNAIIPVLPLIATQAGFLLSGTVITEVIFARPGLGRLMLDSVMRRDTPVIQGLVLCIALIYGVMLLAAHFITRRIDPRPQS